MFIKLRSLLKICVLWVALVAGFVADTRIAAAQTCPIDAAGLCTVPHTTPGCIDPLCCSQVCAIDAFCCMTAWDGNCVFIASFVCSAPPPVPCGSPLAGPCNQVHATPSCSDAACCEVVCAIFPLCCSTSWDQTCVTAASNCAINCTPLCPPQSMDESEPCDIQGDANTPCIDGVPNEMLLTIENAKWICGSLKYVQGGVAGLPDLDAYRLELPDANGDGFGRIGIALQSEFNTQASGTVPTFAALIPSRCDNLADAAIVTQTTSCAQAESIQCIPAGTWFLVVARGDFPAPAVFPMACQEVQSYNLKVTWDDQCSFPCGVSGECFVSHKTAGCSDVGCCAAVCQIDPLCCEKAWDELCVSEAISICNPAPPTNDTCASATPLALGSTPYTLVAASAGNELIPTGCLTAPASLLPDVWFQLSDLRGTVSISSCGVGSFNSALMVYSSPCDGSSQAIACSDNNPLCSVNVESAQLSFPALCNAQYLVRVLSVDGVPGSGSLTVTSNAPPCPLCAGDVNDDNVVNGIDLATVLSGWGGAGSGDVNGDGIVDGVDLTTILSGWGPCP
ncbi:MAG: hypothetical protein EXS15_05405 [Phycisphaerales bacterium]|nr:hypothetical protein [Phycisphaerales bacterium]